LQTKINPNLNTLLEISKEQKNNTYIAQNNDNKSTYFSELNTQFNKHQENDYVDFDYEGFIFKMLSKEGPVTAVADVNNDGKEDIFIGGAKHQVAQLYISKNDDFIKRELSAFNEDILFEDTAATFFDANNDGHIDLIVGSGGNETSLSYNSGLRLYINDGKGNLKKNTNSIIPSNNYNISTISCYDYDNDGDSDIFVGSRSVAGAYGLPPKHYLLENDGNGKFINVLSEKANDISKINSNSTVKMFTNDFDFNGKIEQIITKEYNGKDIPIHLKRDLTSQLPHLKKESLKFSEYAKKSITDLFSEKKLNQSIKKEVVNSESIIALNEGNNQFKIVVLPSRAQFSCINAIELIDVNTDGYLDIIYGGNDYSLKPQFSQLDASFGGLILNKKGSLEWVNANESGLFVRGVITHINIINSNKKGKKILLGINNEKPVLFSLNE